MIICDDNSKKEYFEDIVNVCSYAKELLEKEKYDEAIKVVMSKIRIVEKYKTAGKKECFCFDELFEYEMYIHHKNDDDIIWVKEPVKDLYDLYVHLIESINQNEDEINECVNDMISALKAALRWNPCSAELRFELFKVLLLLKKDIVAASVVLKEAYSYIYRLKPMMQFYRCLGWKFRIEENWDAAMLCTQMSMTFADDYGLALSEELMEEIYMECGKMIEWPEDNEERVNVWKQIMNKYDIPEFEPDSNVLKLAKKCWINSQNDRNKEDEIYYSEIYNDLNRMNCI